MSQLFCSSGIADEYDERGSSLASPTGRVDSIDSISKKISYLDSELNGFCPESELVIDSYVEKHQTSETNDDEQFGYGNLKIDYKAPKQTTKRGSISTREKERKELNKFAGVYAIRTVIGKNQDPLNVSSSRAADLPKERKFKESNQNHSSVSKKPMLVELHTFPGFNPDTLTPLPAFLLTRNVLNIVTHAQKDLNRKPGFKKEFKRIFLTHPSQAVVQVMEILESLKDLFWWFFLEKYQSCPEIQRQLFSRVASNYVKLVFTAWDQMYRETFFKRFPSLVCQAVYAIFCHVFPTSYRQFDERFRQDLADVAYQWIVGTKPIRRCWERWPLELLEPEGMNKEGEIQKNVSKEFVIGWLDAESGETRGLPENSLSAETIKLKQMKSDRRRSLPKILENNLMCPVRSEASVVTRELKVPKKRDDGRLSIILDRPERGKMDALNGKQDRLSNSKLNASTSLQSTKTSNTSLKRSCKNRESCCAGKGPEFQKVAFDLHGHSPLVQHFLQDRRLARESGTSILVQRTEIEKLPPINAPTYQDIIKESLRSSHDLEKQIQSLIEQSSNERIVFGRQQKKEREEFRKKETEVLSRQKEVKKISDLILLQLAKGRNLENDRLIASSIANALKFDEKASK